VRGNALVKEFATIAFGFNVVAINLDADFSRSALMANHIQLPFRTIPIACEAQQFKKESAESDVARISLHLSRQFLNRRAQLTLIE
jgi:hypothetical protein